MKTLIQTIHNSYKFFKIMSDSRMINALEAEVKKGTDRLVFKKEIGFEYKTDKIYFHRHFIVEVIN